MHFQKGSKEEQGKALRRLREALNLTQIDLAAMLDCSQRKISHWESGKGLISEGSLSPLREAMKKPEQLFQQLNRKLEKTAPIMLFPLCEKATRLGKVALDLSKRIEDVDKYLNAVENNEFPFRRSNGELVMPRLGPWSLSTDPYAPIQHLRPGLRDEELTVALENDIKTHGLRLVSILREQPRDPKFYTMLLHGPGSVLFRYKRFLEKYLFEKHPDLSENWKNPGKLILWFHRVQSDSPERAVEIVKCLDDYEKRVDVARERLKQGREKAWEKSDLSNLDMSIKEALRLLPILGKQEAYQILDPVFHITMRSSADRVERISQRLETLKGMGQELASAEAIGLLQETLAEKIWHLRKLEEQRSSQEQTR